MKNCKTWVSFVFILGFWCAAMPVCAMHKTDSAEKVPTFRVSKQSNGWKIRLPEEYDLDLENRALQELARKLLDNQKQNLFLYVKGRRGHPLVHIEAASKASWCVDTVQSLRGFGEYARALIDAARNVQATRGEAKAVWRRAFEAACTDLQRYVNMPTDDASERGGSASTT